MYPSDVIAEFVSAGRLDAAINLLASLNWEQQGDEALAGLYMVTGYLLKRPLTPAAEGKDGEWVYRGWDGRWGVIMLGRCEVLVDGDLACLSEGQG